LHRHDAALKCQFDAFADYVSEAEAKGVENYPLYEWTKQTIEDPVKEAKYTKSFALYVGGKSINRTLRARRRSGAAAATSAARCFASHGRNLV
jgi:hypothetical protein